MTSQHELTTGQFIAGLLLCVFVPVVGLVLGLIQLRREDTFSGALMVATATTMTLLGILALMLA